jgi:hypothetical protein
MTTTRVLRDFIWKVFSIGIPRRKIPKPRATNWNDATVQQQCSALAELLVSKGGTLLEVTVGKSLGARVGWPAARLDKLTQEVKASMQVINEMTGTDPKQQWNCDSVARGNAHMSQLEELGERDLARQTIEGSGETIAELSSKFDEWLAAAGREVLPAQP